MSHGIEEISAFISNVREKFREVKEKLDGKSGVVNLHYMDDINGTIAEIVGMKTNIQSVLGDISSIEENYLEEYNKYLNDIRQMMEKRGIINSSLNIVQTIPEKEKSNEQVNSWTVAGKKKSPAVQAWRDNVIKQRSANVVLDVAVKQRSANAVLDSLSTRTPPKYEPLQYTVSDVQITDKLYIPNVRTTHSLPSEEKLINSIEPGHMYYSHSADTFFMLINPGSILLYGNIGEITPPVGLPSKVKDCKFSPCKHDKCDFYHDPFKFPGRSDRRNYITNSWEYTGALAGQKRQGEQSRMIGSRSNLEIDVEMISESQISIYGSQLMHDMLVYMIVCKSS